MAGDSSSSDSRKTNILLVDDNPSNLVALEAVLKQSGYELITASSGEEALAQLSIHEIAAVLLDVQMPGLDGFETARQIKANPHTKDVPIIFISAVYTEDPYVRKGYEAGGVDYFPKPFNPDVLKLKVNIYAELYQKNMTLRLKEKDANRKAAELEAVLESIPDAIYVGDVTGVTRCNGAAVSLFGLSRREDAQLDFASLAERLQMRDPRTKKPIPVESQCFTLALQGKEVSCDVLIRHLVSGEDRRIQITAAPIRFEGTIIGAVVINTELSSTQNAA